MTLTQQQKDEMWGDKPYSQVRLITETRIWGDAVSRVFITVEIDLNPLTFNLIKKHRVLFKDDEEVQQLLDQAEDCGEKEGFVTCAFLEEYTGEVVLARAAKRAKECEDMLIGLHEFVMAKLDIPPVVKSPLQVKSSSRKLSQKQIIKQRVLIEHDLLDMLELVEGGHTLQEIKDMIYNEEETDDMTDILAIFDDGGRKIDLGDAIELVTNAWNYFPHKALNGLAPVELR
ncbi:TPA: hypothetical protein DEP96_03095 [Candidatus Uhrbacteria bacterium]|nr:hypothetical protein [Candidatus Uhrbacteria bacterium]